MSKLVRAKHPNGAEFTTSEAHAKRTGAPIIDKDTHDAHGRILPSKPATTKDGKPKPTAAPQGTKTEEASK